MMNTEPITVRPATPADIPEIATVAARCFAEAFAGKMPDADIEKYCHQSFSESQLSAEIRNDNNFFIVALYKDQLVGYAKLNRDNGNELIKNKNSVQIERMYVLKEFHQKKIGAALMSKSLEKAAAEQFEIVWLAVWEKNLSAYQFYERWGFEKFGHNLFLRGDDVQVGLLMKKMIGAHSSESTIVPAGISEIPVIRKIAHLTWPITFEEILTRDQINYMLEMMYSESSLENQMNARSNFILFTEKGTYYGYLAYELNYQEDNLAKVHKLYVVPTVHGKGVGKALMLEAEARAREAGHTSITVNVNRYNKAIEFYSKLGYKPVRHEDIDIGNGYLMQDLVMEKQL